MVIKFHRPLFSFLVPTRNNVQMLGNFLDSIADTTSGIERLEVVLCIDSDDQTSLQYEHPGVQCIRTIAPPGSTMGSLNNRCFNAASGEYVMLLNDDVILRTSGWDLKITEAVESFSCAHPLIHVNDWIFGPALCTFPMFSRKTAELVGLCPVDFFRYGIDDHIMDIFHILRSLGHDRIYYMKDIVFEHLNYHLKGSDGQARSYVPKKSPAYDWAIFEKLLPLRKKAALSLAFDIDGHQNNEKYYRERLKLVSTDKSYRKLDPLSVPKHKGLSY